jgi:PERQ amino acid-rich with GYF domain-containing protein
VNIVAPEGFWEPVITPSNPKKPQQHQVDNGTSKSSSNNANMNNNNNNNSNNAKKKTKKENKQVEKSTNRQERNEFEDWCSAALQNLQAQVDIPTFLTFLKDIESPYEVSINLSYPSLFT